MKILLRDGLPYITVTLVYRGQQVELENILLDTGSVGTAFSADKVLSVGLKYEIADAVYRIRGNWRWGVCLLQAS